MLNSLSVSNKKSSPLNGRQMYEKFLEKGVKTECPWCQYKQGEERSKNGQKMNVYQDMVNSIWLPNISMHYSSEPDITLDGKKDFADMIKCKHLKGRGYSGLQRWSQTNHLSLSKQRTFSCYTELKRWQHGRNRPTLAAFEDGGRGYEPRNANGPKKLEKKKMNSPLELLQKNSALPTTFILAQ